MEDILFKYLSKYITLTDEEKHAILKLDVFKQYDKNTVLLKEGQYSDLGFFVIKGCLRSYYLVDGLEKTTSFYTELDTIEPLSKINKTASKHYISCVEDCILVVASSEMEDAIFREFPKFEVLCRKLSEHVIAKHSADFDTFKLSSPEDRYLNILEKRPDLIQRVPQHQLASFIGVKPQSLSRIKARLISKQK